MTKRAAMINWKRLFRAFGCAVAVIVGLSLLVGGVMTGVYLIRAIHEAMVVLTGFSSTTAWLLITAWLGLVVFMALFLLPRVASQPLVLKQPFRPVTLVLETPEEVLAILAALAPMTDGGLADNARAMGYKFNAATLPGYRVYQLLESIADEQLQD